MPDPTMDDVFRDIKPGPKPRTAKTATHNLSHFFATPEDNQRLGDDSASRGKPVIGDYGKSQYDNYQSFVDPNWISPTQDPELDYEQRLNQLQFNRAEQQSTMDRLGNGMGKMAGSFMNGMLSAAGIIYAIPASIVGGIANAAGADVPALSAFWDNPLSNLGNDISEHINESLVNYQSKAEHDASAWSPKYWATMNFLADNILSNIGYAGAAFVTGAGLSKLLTKVAPYIASKNLAAGIEAVKSGAAADAAFATTKAGQALHTWDFVRQAISIGVASAGEASAEALMNYEETKKLLTASAVRMYGAEELIPDSILEGIEEDSRNAGNITYGINIPILAGANVIQWGRALTPFKSELRSAIKNPIPLKRLTPDVPVSDVAAVPPEVLTRMGKVKKGLEKAGSFLQSNVAESAQEGLQFMASETSKNWYHRKHDPEGYEVAFGFLEPGAKAMKDLFSTKEGVANLLGGFGGGMPFSIGNAVADMLEKKDAKTISQSHLSVLNDASISKNLKTYIKGIIRHTSAEKSLQEAILNDDEHEGRNAKYDMLKAYINTRILTGRADLLNEELEQMKKMPAQQLHDWLGMAEEDPLTEADKNEVIDSMRMKADEMFNTYKNIDRVFNADNYRLSKLPPEERKKKEKDLGEYKEMMWSYMMDYKDRDRRAKKLSQEVTAAFSNLMEFAPLMEDKFGDNAELNNLYREYIAASVEKSLNKKYDPNYKEDPENAQVATLLGRLKSRIKELVGDKATKFESIEDFMGEGKQDYIDRYIFAVEKQLAPLVNNPLVAASVSEVNYHEVIRKMWDMTDLHRGRQMAIYGYNQLASMIKSGTYVDPQMINPDYDEAKHKDIEKIKDGKPNPDYVPKFIPSDDMLMYDGYKQARSERTAFRDGIHERAKKNREDQEAFNKEMEKKIDIKLTPESKDFHDRFNQYLYDTAMPDGGIQDMKKSEFEAYSLQTERLWETAMATGAYATHTKKARDNFNLQGFIDINARRSAVDSDSDRREKLHKEAVERRAIQVVNWYYAHKDDVVNGVPNNWTVADIKEGFMVGVHKLQDPQIIDRAVEIINEEDAAQTAAEAKDNAAKLKIASQGVVPVAKEMLVNQARWKKFLDGDALGELWEQISEKILKGGYKSLTPREKAVYTKSKKDEFFVNKLGKVYDMEESPMADSTLSRPEPSSDTIVAQDDIIANANEAASKVARRETFVPSANAGPRLLLSRSDLLTEGQGHNTENVYDERNKVIPKQLTDLRFFTDPNSPLNFHNKPQVRIKASGEKSPNGEDQMLLQASADGKTWITTPWDIQGLYEQDGKTLIPISFIRWDDKDTSPGRLARDVQEVNNHRQWLREIRAQAIKSFNELKDRDPGVPMEIRGVPGFGKLIDNKLGPDGEHRVSIPLTELSPVLNDPTDHTSGHVFVYQNNNLNNMVAVYKDTPGLDGAIRNINERPGISIGQSLLNASAAASSSPAGHMGIGIPTGKKNDKGYELFPVLLAGKLLSSYTTDAYDIGSGENKGSEANIGEVLVDAILNPWKAEHADLIKDMFAMVGMADEFKGIDGTTGDSWKRFYTNQNIDEIINKVFFSSGMLVAKKITRAVEYTNPFELEVVDTTSAKEEGGPEREGGIKIRINIRGAIELPGEAEIYITHKDGKIRRPKGDEQEADFVQRRIQEMYDFRELERGKGVVVKDTGIISYEQIQNKIKTKAFHVQIGEMSQNSKTAPAYDGFKFDENGKLRVVRFKNYFDYVSQLGLANATVQSIEQGKTRQFFVNQPVYLQRKGAEPIIPPEEKPASKKKLKDPKDVVLKPKTNIIKAASKTGSMPVADDGFNEHTFDQTYAMGPGGVIISNIIPEDAKPDQPPAPKKRGPKKKKTPPIDKTIEDMPDPTDTSNWEDRMRAAGEAEGFTPAGEPMIDTDLIGSVGQMNRKFSGSINQIYEHSIMEEVTRIMLDNLLERRGEGALSAYIIKKQAKEALEDARWAIMRTARKSLKKITYEEWKDREITKPGSPNYGPLRIEELNKLAFEKQKQYMALNDAIVYDDIERFIQLDKDKQMTPAMRAAVTLDPGKDGKGVFFMGYLNRALINLVGMNIVQVSGEGSDAVQLDEENGYYTQRYDDGWSLQINPKKTLRMEARLVLQSVDRIKIITLPDGSVKYVGVPSETGFAPLVRYDHIFNQVVEIGKDSTIDSVDVERTFKYQLMISEEYERVPVIYALRLKLEKIRKRDPDRYDQIIQQLSGMALSLRTNSGFLNRVVKDTNERNAKSNMFAAAKTKISDQIAATWEGQFMQKASQGSYVLETNERDRKTGEIIKGYAINENIEKTFKTAEGSIVKKVDFARAYMMEIDEALAGGMVVFNDYLKLVRIVRDRLGIQLVEDDIDDKGEYGLKAAGVLKIMNEEYKDKKKKGSKLARIVESKTNQVKSFDDIFKVLLGAHLSGEIRGQIADNSFNPDEPFRNSSNVLDTLAKLFQSHHASVINSQFKNTDDENVYGIITGNMLHEELKYWKDEDELKALRLLPMTRYNYFINKMIKPHPNKAGVEYYDPEPYWQSIADDQVEGIDVADSAKNANRVRRATKKSSLADLSLLTMGMFHNNETIRQYGNLHDPSFERPMAWYFSPVGDSMSPSSVSFAKFYFGFDYNNGKLKLHDGRGEMKQILFTQYKSEINAISENLKKFKRVTKKFKNDIAAQKERLDKDYDYVEYQDAEGKTVLRPGSGSRQYYFGQGNYAITSDSELYDVMPDHNKEIHPVAIKDVFYKDGELNDEALYPIFEKTINEVLSNIVNKKIDEMMPHLRSIFHISAPAQVGDDFIRPEWKTTLVDNKYINSIIKSFGAHSVIDGRKIQNYNSGEVLYSKYEEAIEKSFPVQLLKTMIIDQQVNSFMFYTNFAQMSNDFAQFDLKHDWGSFMENIGKRHKMLNSPRAISASPTQVQNFVFNDMLYGQRRVNRKEAEAQMVWPEDKEWLAFMDSDKELSKWVSDGMVPAYYNSLIQYYYTHKHKAGKTDAEVSKMLQDLLKSKVTDGGSYMTLREYLFQMLVDGEIQNNEYFELHNRYRDFDHVFTEDDYARLKLPGVKMVATGNKNNGMRKVSVFVKDAKTVLLPGQVKNTKFEQVLRDLMDKEDKDASGSIPTPGYELIPASAMKAGDGKVFDLFDKNGEVVKGWAGGTVINDAIQFNYPRKIRGRQVENPESHTSDITGSIQAQDFIFIGMNPNNRFAKDKFNKKSMLRQPANEKAWARGERFVDQSLNPYPGNEQVPEEGATGLELGDWMVKTIQKMSEAKIEKYIAEYGLTYDISEEWKQEFDESGLGTIEEFDALIDEMSASKDKSDRDYAHNMRYIKYNLIVNNIDKMIQDIKRKVWEKKDMDVSQQAIFNEKMRVSESQTQLKVPLTFSPGNKQYQEIIISRLQSLVKGIKRHGFSAMQTSSVLLDKPGQPPALKGYGLTRNAKGEVDGFTNAEIAVCWNFRDATGRLLDYNKYVDENGKVRIKDGIPMIDPELLKIVSYRVPNTGLKMIRILNIVQFLKPMYRGIAVVPDDIYNQMNSDLDYDMLYNYSYNHTRDRATGQLQKIKGVLSNRQVDMMEILDTREGAEHAITHTLMKEDPNFRRRRQALTMAYKELKNQVRNLRLRENKAIESEEDEDIEDAEITGVAVDDIKKRIIELTKTEAPAAPEVPAAPVEDEEAEAEVVPAVPRPSSLLEKQYQAIIDDYKEITGMVEARKANWDGKGTPFTMRGYLMEKADNYLHAQSYKQLEVAYTEVYHHVTNDWDSMIKMTTPLTTSDALKYVNEKLYHGKTFAQHKTALGVDMYNSEATRTNQYGKGVLGDNMINIMAAAPNTFRYLELVNASVGVKVEKHEHTANMRWLTFEDEKGNIITSTGSEKGYYIRDTESPRMQVGYFLNKPVLNVSTQENLLELPNRLDRIMDVTGRIPVSGQTESLLQAFVDLKNAPEIVYANVNSVTANAFLVMNRTGYVEHNYPFMQQEILEDYTQVMTNAKSPYLGRKMKKEDRVNAFVDSYLIKAGINPKDYNTSEFEALGAHDRLYNILRLANRGDAKYDGAIYHSVAKLEGLISQRFSGVKPDQTYYLNQLYVFEMFMRADAIGQQLLEIAQRVNLKNKGLTGGILGIQETITKNRALSYPMSKGAVGKNIGGGERMGPYNKRSNPYAVNSTYHVAYRIIKQATEWLKSNHNIFSDLTPLFTVVREQVSNINHGDTLKEQERTMLHLVKFLVSNPELYVDFYDVIPEPDRYSAHGIRKHVYMDINKPVKGKTKTADGKDTITYEVLNPSLARRINDMIDTKVIDGTGTYGHLYPVLAHFKTSIKDGSDIPSWVYNFHTNNFKERIGSEAAGNIFNMLRDPNPEIQKIAKYMYLYYYLGSGVTSPQSFGHLLAQEFLMRPGGFADTLNGVLSDWNSKMTALNRESQTAVADYDKPEWFRLFDDNLIYTNREARSKLLAFYTQYIQNSPFLNAVSLSDRTSKTKYIEGKHFVSIPGTDQVVLVPQEGSITIGNHEEHPASFIDDNINVYIINPDYNTYTRYNRAGHNLYNEYEFNDDHSQTLLASLAIKLPTPPSTTKKVADEGFDGSLGGVYDPHGVTEPKGRFVLNKPIPVHGLLQEEFADSAGIPDSQIPIRQELIPELRQLEALGQALMPLVPAGTTMVPFSTIEADRISNRDPAKSPERSGMLRSGELNAYGLYNPTFEPGDGERSGGQIDIAYEYINRQKQSPLLFKQVLLHETVHASHNNVYRLMERVEQKKLTLDQAAAILGLTGAKADARIKKMYKGYERTKALYEHLHDDGKINKTLREAYMKHSGMSMEDVTSGLKIAMASETEFVARLFNDQVFRNALREVPYKKQHVLIEILKAIAELLGLDQGTALFAAFNNVFTTLESLAYSKIPATGFTKMDMHSIYDNTNPGDALAIANIAEIYQGVSNMDVDRMSAEELVNYHRLVMNKQIEC